MRHTAAAELDVHDERGVHNGIPERLWLGGPPRDDRRWVCGSVLNDDCAPSPVSTYNDGGADVAMTSRDLIASDVDPGERFEVSIRVFDTDGILIANLADERRRKDDGDCGCDRLGYRWNGDRFDQW